MKLLAENLKRLVKNKGKTLDWLAEELGMKTRQGVYDMLARPHVSEERVQSIEKILEVDRGKFLEPEQKELIPSNFQPDATTQFQVTQLNTYMLQIQSENVALKKDLFEAQGKIIELQEKLISLQDKAYNLSQKIIASGTGVKKNS